MILTRVEIGVVFEQREKHFTQLVPGLEAHFALQCLMCGRIHQLKTPMVYKLKADEVPFKYIHPIKTVIAQTRSCENCGLLSTLPKLDVQRLEKVLQKTITPEFITLRSQDRPPFLAQRLFERMQLI